MMENPHGHYLHIWFLHYQVENVNSLNQSSTSKLNFTQPSMKNWSAKLVDVIK